VATIPVLVGPSGAQNPKPVIRRHAAKRGKVVNKRLRLPNVSTMVFGLLDCIKGAQVEGHTGIKSRGSEDPIHQSGAHSNKQSSGTAKSSLKEDGRRVIGNNIDATKLLHKHHKASRLSSAPVSWHSEKLQEEVTAFLNVRLSF
jgi:hypothetical protein